MILRITTSLVLSVLFISACGPGDPGEENERQGPHLEMDDEVELIAEDAGEVEATFAVRNAGDEPLDVGFSHDEWWLDFDPPELTVDPGSEEDVVARGNCGALDDSETTAFAEVDVITNDHAAGDRTLSVSLECESAYIGSLQVTVTGLDIPELDEPNPAITVAGIDSDAEHQITQPGTTTLENLPVGAYEISVDDVTGGPATFEGDGQTATVELDDLTEIDVEYAVVPGALHVDATGLADGVEFEADVDGPDLSESVVESTEFDDLYPGDYTVAFQTVLDDNTPYDPDPEQIETTVYSDDTAEAVADYSLRPGDLHIIIDIPDSPEIEFLVEDSDGSAVHSFTADSSTVETIDLEPGTYLVTIDGPVEDEWGNIFVFEGLDETFDVEMDEEQTHTVSSQLPTEVTTEDDDPDTYGSLREVVDRVEPESVITFDESVQTIELDEVIEIDQPLSIVGNGDPEETVITQADNGAEGLLTIDVPGALGGKVLIQQLRFADADEFLGAIQYEGEIDFHLVETEFVNLHSDAHQGGGAATIWHPGNDVDIRIEDCRFIDNTSLASAGALSIGSSPDTDISVVIEHSVFEGNTAPEQGMALATWGGAIAIQGTAVSIRDSTFSDNEATPDEGGVGGAIFTDSLIDITRSTFKNNAAAEGGAIAFGDEDTTEANFSGLRHSHLLENNAESAGGAIYAHKRVLADGVLFEDNSADHGGAIYVDDTRMYTRNSTFSENSADLGAGIFLDADSIARIRYNTFVDNYLLAVYVDSDSYPPVMRANYVTDPVGAEAGSHFRSRGYNLFTEDFVEDDFDTTADSDLFGASASYSSLWDNGGYTDTYTIDPGSNGYRDIPAEECRRQEYAFDVIPPESHQPLHLTDQRDMPRPAGAHCTRGAWEPDAHLEAFEDAEFSEQFESGSFEGADGRTWEYTDVRSEGEYGVPYGMQDFNADDGDLPGARFVDEGATISTAEFDGVDGDVESIAIVYRAAGGEPGERSLEVRADGDHVADSGIFGDDDDEFGFPPRVHVLEIDDLSDFSDFEFEIRNTSPGGEGDIVIDRITWR